MGASPLLLLPLLTLLQPALVPAQELPAHAPWSLTHTDRLKRALLVGYDRYARPAEHDATSAVSVGLQTNHVELDDVAGKLTVHGWLKLTWHDDKLKWNASDYGGLTTLHMGIQEVWRPDVVQYNSASDNEMAQYGKTQCLVYSDGSVLWVPPAKLTAFCHPDLRGWPLDRQTCQIVFGSWTYDVKHIDLRTNDTGDVDVQTDSFLVNPQWALEKIRAVREERTYPCCEEAYVSIHYHLSLRRQGDARLTQLRAQVAVAVLLALLAHALPAAHAAPRAVLAAAPALALLYLSQTLPHSEPPPDIATLYKESLYVVFASAVLSVLVLNMARARRALPSSARFVLSSRALSCLAVKPRADSAPQDELPGAAWVTAATALDRAGGLLLAGAFVLLLLLYSC